MAMRSDGGQLDSGWERGWEGHQRAQAIRLASLTMAEKLAWLEQAQRVVLSLAEARRQALALSRAGS